MKTLSIYPSVENLTRTSLEYEPEHNESVYLANYLWQNFNIEPQVDEDSVKKVQLPPMLPGTKCFADFDGLNKLDCFERKTSSQNQVR